MGANRMDFSLGMSHGDVTRNQGAYNEGSTLDSRPWGSNSAVTQSGSVSEVGYDPAQSVKYEGESSKYSGNSGIEHTGWMG